MTTANDKAHSEVLEAAKTGPVTLEVASCARPALLLNHGPLLRKTLQPG